MRTSDVILSISLLGLAFGLSPAVSFDGTRTPEGSSIAVPMPAPSANLAPGSNALGGTVGINAGTLEITGGAALAGSTAIVEKNAAIFRIGGATATLPQTLSFDLAGGTATGISGDVSGTANFTVEVLTDPVDRGGSEGEEAHRGDSSARRCGRVTELFPMGA